MDLQLKVWKSISMIKSPWPKAEMDEFLEHHFYAPDAFLISEVIKGDSTAGEIFAVCKPDTSWLVAPYQRGPELRHPRHVSGGDLLMLTASLGSLHAYFFHACKWHEGWVGFGNRMDNVQFHNLAKINLPLELYSKETRVRRGSKRTLISFEFRFTQDGKPIYTSEQTAMFIKAELA